VTDPDPLSPDLLRIKPGPAVVATRPPPRKLRHRKGKPFLKGPIDWGWLEVAMALPGRALAIGLEVWREAGCRGSRTVELNLSRPPAGIPRRTAQRALYDLERAGLVTVERLPGRALVVTLNELPDPQVT
jgi:hypothetical protein